MTDYTSLRFSVQNHVDNLFIIKPLIDGEALFVIHERGGVWRCVNLDSYNEHPEHSETIPEWVQYTLIPTPSYQVGDTIEKDFPNKAIVKIVSIYCEVYYVAPPRFFIDHENKTIQYILIYQTDDGYNVSENNILHLIHV